MAQDLQVGDRATGWPVAGGPSIALRLLPPGTYVGRARILVERSLLVYRNAWLLFVSGFFEPLFYLLALGVGLGKLTGGVVGPGGELMSYPAFVAPALLAASAMNGAVYDTTFNLFYKFRYAKLYDAMLATPLGPMDIALGEISWALLRGGVYAAGFQIVMIVMGLVASPWALLTVPAALLIAFGFAAAGMAATTFMRSWQDIDLVNLAVMPMFLFATTFFPLTVYPPVIQVAVQCLPLYQAIEIMRALSTGAVDLSMVGHVAYFVVMALAGVAFVSRRLARLLRR